MAGGRKISSGYLGSPPAAKLRGLGKTEEEGTLSEIIKVIASRES